MYIHKIKTLKLLIGWITHTFSCSIGNYRNVFSLELAASHPEESNVLVINLYNALVFLDISKFEGKGLQFPQIWCQM